MSFAVNVYPSSSSLSSPYPTTSTTSTTSSSSSTVIAPGASAGLTQSAVDIAGDEGVIATLGSDTQSTTGLTYDASGLLNDFVEAGTGIDSEPADAAASANDPLAAQTDASETGYIPPPVPSSVNLNNQWSQVLQSQPAMAGQLTSDLQNQAIAGSLSAWA